MAQDGRVYRVDLRLNTPGCGPSFFAALMAFVVKLGCYPIRIWKGTQGGKMLK